MTIQIISNDRLSHFNNSDYVISPLRSPKSLDEFDLNIVDLSTESLWRNRSNNYSSINEKNNCFKEIEDIFFNTLDGFVVVEK